MAEWYLKLLHRKKWLTFSTMTTGEFSFLPNKEAKSHVEVIVQKQNIEVECREGPERSPKLQRHAK